MHSHVEAGPVQDGSTVFQCLSHQPCKAHTCSILLMSEKMLVQAEEAAQEATRKAREALEGPEALAFEERLRKLGFAMQRLPPRDRVADKIQDLESECAPF